MSAKLPEWEIKLDNNFYVGSLYIENLSFTEQHALRAVLAMCLNTSYNRIRIKQVESKLLSESEAEDTR